MSSRAEIGKTETPPDIIATGSKVGQQAHNYASIILALSFFVAMPVILVALRRFIILKPSLITLGVIFAVGAIYYYIIPTKYIPRFGYLVMDYFFYVTITTLFFFADPFIGIPILFFYMALFVIIDAVSYGWRDLIITAIGASAAPIIYIFFHAPQLMLIEKIGLSTISTLILWILAVDMRALADLALSEERRVTKLESELTRLKELEELKSEFLDVASHQLRTPLTEVRWAFDILKSEAKNLSAAGKSIIEKGALAAERLVRLVGSFIAVTSVEGSAGEYVRREHINLVELVKEIADDFSGLIQQKGVTLKLLLPSEPISITGDRFLFKGGVSNVVDNAIRYTPKGGGVTMQVERDQKSTRIVISDTGMGITEDEAAKIFTKFYRSPRALKVHTDGSGLGLYYARAVFLRHHGTISIRGAEGTGTTVTIEIPKTPSAKKNEN